MKTKKSSSVIILLAITVLVYAVATVFFCYTTKPAVTEGEFPFSITYEYKGETKTLSGITKCEFFDSCTIYGKHYRYWNEEVIYENPENVDNPNVIEHNVETDTLLAVHANMSAGYFMGDPLYKDYYAEYGLEGVEPSIEYYDYKNDISLNEDNKEEILDSYAFKIIDYTYAEPIENSISFSGINYAADNIIIFVAINFVFFLLCLIFVRKDKEYRYSKLDKCGIVINFIIGIVAIPFIYIFCMLFSALGSGAEIIEQMIFNMPPFAILCLTLSIAFRRKGFSKTGFFIQFGGFLLFILFLLL